MWRVTSHALRLVDARCWQRQLCQPSPGSLRCHPAWTSGAAAARGLSRTAPAVRFSPGARSLFDEPLGIAVQGLRPRQPVTLRASVQDEAGERFEASARYEAEESGELDLGRSPALPGGSFCGLEPMGLLWALQPQKPFWCMVKRDVQTPLRLLLEVFEGHGPPPGRLLAQGQHERIFLRDGVQRVPVREGRIRGTLFLPPEAPFPGIIDIHGLEGGLLEYRASLLANYGFATLALAYYHYEDLPQKPTELHLEYFEEAVNYMLQHPQVRRPRLGLLGYSKGGELCLAMAAFLKNITAVASINSPVTITAIPLCYKDKTIPHLPWHEERATVNQSNIYDCSDVLDDPFQVPDHQSRIPVENIEAKLLFIAGQDDNLIKSEYFAIEACKRLQAQGKNNFQILSYPGTGHCFDPPFFPLNAIGRHPVLLKRVFLGGELKAYSKAQVQAWLEIQAFFNKHLNEK
uniref:Acyl-coenzyme A thioesterase 5-like n=1 Tax=Nothoprocta perdicaria TaxID=30464 RepID=A0A8C7E9E7_NOTPE